MLSYQILNYYKIIKDELIGLKKELEPVFTWTNLYTNNNINMIDKFFTCSTANSSDGIHYIIKGGNIRTEYKDIVKKMKSSFSSNSILKFGELKQKIIQYRINNNIEIDDYIEGLIDETHKLFSCYDEFQKDDTSHIKMINLSNELIKYKGLLEKSIEMYSDFEKLYNENEEAYNIDGILCIQLLNEEFSMGEFTSLLNKIENMYDETMSLLQNKKENKISELKIIKIESGSLFSKIAGESISIKFVKDILKKIIMIVHKEYEVENKIITHQSIAKTLKDDINIMKTLQECGCNIDKSKQLLEKTFNQLAKDGLDIAKSSGNIKIDDEEFSIKKSIKQKFLNDTKKKLLNSGNEEEGKDE